jgi:uncharacterized membrane protein required for colicin V production
MIDGLVILTVLAVGYIWGSRGFFSSMLHMLCVLLAGAIALAFWEPIAYLLLDRVSKQWLVNLVWAASLGVPFSLLLAIIRISLDKIVPNNVDLDGATNLIGGIVCGAVSGVVTAGILIFTLGMLQGPPGGGYLMGGPPVKYNNTGSLVKEKGPFLPVDKLTAWFYGYTSEAALRTDTSLAKYHPNLPIEGTLLRTNFNDGGSRPFMTPKSVEVQGRYTVGQKAALSVGDLLNNSFSPGSQTVTRLNGDQVNKNEKNDYIEGYVVKFKSGARETGGRIVVGAAQVWLIVYNEQTQSSLQLQPIAMVSQAALQEGDKSLTYGRWRFDKQDVYIASVGGAEDPPMAFEFLVPREYTPLSLNVKGVRTDVSSMGAARDYTSTAARDAAVRDSSILSASKAVALNRSGAKTINLGDGFSDSKPVHIYSALLPNVIINRDNVNGLTIDEERKIVNGDAKFTNNDLNNRGIDSKLQVRQFAATEDTVIVQVDVSLNSELSLVKNQVASEATGAPVLTDTLGQRYSAVGYMYKDATEFDIRFLPGQPIQSKDELPKGGPTSSRLDQTFILLYRISSNASLATFTIGDSVVAEFQPPLPIKKH